MYVCFYFLISCVLIPRVMILEFALCSAAKELSCQARNGLPLLAEFELQRVLASQ